MKLTPPLRKATELGIALTAIAALILAGCGGGGSSNAGSTVSNITTTVTPYKGMFTSGNVVLKDVNGNTITLVAGGTIDANGKAAVTFPANVAFPITVEVSGTYTDETTGASAVIAAGSPLRGMIPATTDANAASGVPVTAITDLARATLPTTGFTAASAVAAITGAASNVLGVTSYAQAMLPPVFNSQGQTSDANTLKLTALAHVISQQGTGATLYAKLQNINASLVAGSAVNAVISQSAFNNALTSINRVGGASGVLPVGATPPTIPVFTLPGGSLGGAVGGGNVGGGSGGVTPAITGFYPAAGAAGAAVYINGTNLNSFFPEPLVKFGTTAATVTSFSYLGGVQITVNVPTGLAAGSHAISVSNGDGSGSVSAGAFTVTAPVATGPAAPVGVTATAATATQIDLSWTAVAGATSYNVYRSTSANVVTIPANKIQSLATAWTRVIGLMGGTPYFFVVTAVNASGESMASSEVSAITNFIPAGVTAPTTASIAPLQDKKVLFGNFGTTVLPPATDQIILRLQGNAVGDVLNIYRSTSPGVAISPTTYVGTSVLGSFTQRFDTGLTAGTKYYYKTTVTNAAGEGPVSAELVARTPLASVGSGAGLTITPALKGVGTIANLVPHESNLGGGLISSFNISPAKVFEIQYFVDVINGDLLYLYWIDTTGGVADIATLDVASTWKQCAITTAVGYTACSALGITFDPAAGSVTFAGTPVAVTTGTTLLGTKLTISGTLNFTPF